MYTNIVDIPDSILFLTSCRLAIKESVMTNADLDQEDRYDLSNFVMNEASDYQVMNIVVNDEFVEEKYSLEEEIDLFDQYREMVVDNIYEFAGVMESEDLHNILYEIGPVSGYGISTAVPILEFLHESGALQEGPIKTFQKYTGVGKKSRTLIGPKVKEKTAAAKKKAAELAGKGKAAAGKYGAKAKDMAGKGYGAAKSGARKAGGAAKSGAMWAGGKAKAGATRAGGAAKSGAMWAGGKAKAGAGAAGRGIAAGGRAAGRGAAKVGGAAVKGAKAAGGAAVKGAKAVGGAVMKNKKVAGSVALAAAAIYAGVKAYQRFFGSAARACRGQSGAEKTACMGKAKRSALAQQISATTRGMSACANSKNPDKCRAAINSRVSKLKGKMAKVG